MIPTRRRLRDTISLKALSTISLFFVGIFDLCAAEVDLDRAISTLIPKRETGIIDFLEKYPQYDGRDVVIAVFDTGVDPAAHGLQTTTTGQRKILDIIDGSGAGDVDMSHTVDLAEITPEAPLFGLTGRPLTLPAELEDAEIEIRLGMKRGKELFHETPWTRLMEARKSAWQLKNNQDRAERKRNENTNAPTWKDKHPDDRSLEEQDLAARSAALEALEESFLKDDPGPVYDCILWAEGDTFKVIVDTDEDGDFSNETILRPYGIEGEYGRFADPVSATFVVQVYETGKLLSIVTVSGSHGTHVAAIAAAHFPEDPKRNGIAPGARILSIRMGDIRTGGSSNYFGEMRAVASAARYKVDIMNASWGGASVYQDGTNLGARLYDKLVRDYGVTAFVSAGNNGPALSTLGSPGGEATHVIGVGAHVSQEMGKYLYALSEENPDTAYGFTSRGPAKNGDLGVDIFAPGGATATLASDALRGSQLYNGTSMAAPSAAGLGALLVSAAKQLDLKHSPERIKAALMNTAVAVEGDPFAEGAGLIQAEPALEFLKTQNDEIAWDLHYALEGAPGTFRSGPGLYLREKIQDSQIDVPITVRPHFSEFSENTKAYTWEADVVLKTSAPWLIAPQYIRLANGPQRLSITIDANQLPEVGTTAFAELSGHLANTPESGTLFRFPVTIIQPQEMSDPESFVHEEVVSLTPSSTRRIFLEAPDRADKVELTVKLPDNGADTRRRFVINVLSLADDASFREKNLTRYLWFTPGEEKTLLADVHGGQVVEITIHQYWPTPGEQSLELHANFLGLGADSSSLAIGKNFDFTSLRLHPLNTIEGTLSAKLDTAVLSHYPLTTEKFPGDARMLFPPTPQETEPFIPFRLRQTFEVTLEEDSKLKIGHSRPYDIFQDFGGDLFSIYHESGDLLYAGSSFRMKAIQVPKGKLTVTREILSFEEALLNNAEDRPLILELEAKLGALASYPDTPSASRLISSSTLNLTRGTHQSFYIKNTQTEAISKLKNAPDLVSGNIEVKNKDEHTLLEIPIWIQPGDVFEDIVNKDPEPQKGSDEPTPLEDFGESIYKEKIDFIEAQIKSVDPEIASKRDTLLASLIEDNPEQGELYILGAKLTAIHAYLVPEFMGRPEKPKSTDNDVDSEETESIEEIPAEDSKPNTDSASAIIRDLEKARELSDISAVAQYFGARPTVFPGDTEARHENEELDEDMETARDLIADTWRLQAAIAIVLESSDDFKEAYLKLKKWESDASEETTQLLGYYYEQQGLLGLSLKQMNAALKEKPTDSKVLEERAALYQELGWELFHEREQLLKHLRKAAPLNLL